MWLSSHTHPTVLWMLYARQWDRRGFSLDVSLGGEGRETSKGGTETFLSYPENKDEINNCYPILRKFTGQYISWKNMNF